MSTLVHPDDVRDTAMDIRHDGTAAKVPFLEPSRGLNRIQAGISEANGTPQKPNSVHVSRTRKPVLSLTRLREHHARDEALPARRFHLRKPLPISRPYEAPDR